MPKHASLFEKPTLPEEEAALEVALAVRDYILGLCSELSVDLDLLGDYGPVFIGARLAMHDEEYRYLRADGAVARLNEVMALLRPVYAGRPVKNVNPPGRSVGAAGASNPSKVYLETLRGPILCYILEGIRPEPGVYAPRRVQKVLQALGGTDYLNEPEVLKIYLEVQLSLSASPRAQGSYDIKSVGRNRSPASLKRPAWSFEAQCAGLDTDDFYPEDDSMAQELGEICMGCVRQDECLELAVVNNEQYGFWGGVGPRGRSRIRRAIRAGRDNAKIQRIITNARLDFQPMSEERLAAMITGFNAH